MAIALTTSSVGAQFPFPDRSCADGALVVVQVEQVAIAAAQDAPSCSVAVFAGEFVRATVEVVSGIGGTPSPVPPPPIDPLLLIGGGIVGGRVSAVSNDTRQSFGSAECGPFPSSCFASFDFVAQDDAVVTCESWTVTVAVLVSVSCGLFIN